MAAVSYGSDLLQVGQPAPFGFIMGMTDIIAGYRAFSTDFTFTRHDIYAPCNGLFVKSNIIHTASEKATFFPSFKPFFSST